MSEDELLLDESRFLRGSKRLTCLIFDRDLLLLCLLAPDSGLRPNLTLLSKICLVSPSEMESFELVLLRLLLSFLVVFFLVLFEELELLLLLFEDEELFDEVDECLFDLFEVGFWG